jgi:hypothetical protein
MYSVTLRMLTYPASLLPPQVLQAAQQQAQLDEEKLHGMLPPPDSRLPEEQQLAAGLAAQAAQLLAASKEACHQVRPPETLVPWASAPAPMAAAVQLRRNWDP